MSFAFPSLLWLGVPLLAATLAVHLLNLRRQRPQPWAAMDFLLESERINRSWINLRQWLLLALRMLVIALAVFALAKPQIDKFSLSAMADSRVLHILVLDDSYSMSDAGAQTSAWDDALEAVDRVLAFASERPDQQVAIVRTSDVAAESRAEKASQIVEGAEEISQLRLATAAWQPSQLAGGLTPAIEKAALLTESAPTGIRRRAYVITDARLKDAAPLATLGDSMEALRDAGAEVRWVSCVDRQSQNLTITDLSLLPGPLTAGVEMTMSVSVANNGPQVASGVLVQLERDDRPSPAIEMGTIQPGETVMRRFGVLFREPGEHRVTAQLEADSVAADNARYSSFTLAPTRRVLLIDGSERNAEGLPYAAALRPNEQLNTGWRPERITAAAASAQTDFSAYAAVLLLDAPRLSDGATAALKDYVRQGGGLFVAVGPQADRGFYNRSLFGESPSPLAPITLDKPARPPPAPDSAEGDMLVSDHALFNVFAGERDSFLGLVDVNYLYQIEPFEDANALQILATHAGGAPLVVESAYGDGRVVLLLTTVAQRQQRDESWSNLSTLPVFPVFALELAAHVAHPRLQPTEMQVAQPWSAALAAPQDARVRISQMQSDGATLLLTEVTGAGLAKQPGPTEAGYYQLEATTGKGVSKAAVAVNVNPNEGDLRLAPAEDLSGVLGKLGVAVETAVALSASAGEQGPSRLPPLLGLIALGLLLGEQALAISASYHEPRRGAS